VCVCVCDTLMTHRPPGTMEEFVYAQGCISADTGYVREWQAGCSYVDSSCGFAELLMPPRLCYLPDVRT